MRAILKNELRSYLHSPVSYAATGLFIMIISIYYTLDNLRGRSSDLYELYSTMGLLFLFIIPVLTSRIIAEDKRTGTDILLLTSPLGLTKIVGGKYLAVCGLLLINIALTVVFPLFLLLFTKLPALPLAGYYIGLILLAASLAAFGIFISTLTESQVVATIIGFVVLLMLFIANPIGKAMGGFASKVFRIVSPFAQYDEFVSGRISIQGILYFLSTSFLFLFLSGCVISFARQKGNTYGRVYARVSTASVVIIILLINLIAQQFSLSFDLSAGKRFTIGESTKSLLASLEQDVVVYGLFDEGRADRDYSEICELLKKYVSHSKSRVSVEYIDPDSNTLIIDRLDPDGTIGLRKNDFYITDGEKGERIKYQDLFTMEYDAGASAWFKTGAAVERAISGAIHALSDYSGEYNVYSGDCYTLYTSGEDTELPAFHDSYSNLLLDVPENEVIAHEFFGLYFPAAAEFDVPAGGNVLIASPGNKALAAAWESDGYKHVLVGSPDFLSDNVKTDYPAYYAVNQYLDTALREWVSSDLSDSEIEIIDTLSGELQIPRDKADFICFLLAVVLPAGIFLRGLIVWRGRRYL